MDVAQLSIAVDSTSVPKATKELDRLATTGEGLTGVVQALAAAWASWKIVQYAKDAATMAARYETLGVVMGVVGNNAGYTRLQMDAYATSLQKAGISMVESRNSLTVMAQSHIDLAKATALGRLAQDAAVVGNINSSQAFQAMIKGIQSAQVETLRTIGINVNFENSYKTFAASIGKTTQQLTEQEKTQSRTNAVLEKAKDLNGAYEASMGTAGKQLLSMTRYAEDLQTVIGTLFGATFETLIQAMNQTLQDTKKWLDQNTESARAFNAMLGSAATNFVGLVKDLFSVVVDMGKFNDELTIGEVLAGGLALSMAVVRDVIMAAVGFVQALWGSLEVVIAGTLAGVQKLISFVSPLAGPKWVDGLYNHGSGLMDKGTKNITTSATAALYNPGGTLMGEVRAEQAKRDAEKTNELARIAASQASKDKALADSLAATAERLRASSAKELSDAIKSQNDTLDRERILMEQGTTAAYAYDLAKQGISGKVKQDLILKQILLEYDKSHVGYLKEEAAAMAKYADDVYKLADTGPGKIKASPSTLDAEKYAGQLNQRDDYGTKMARLNAAWATGILTLDSYNQEQHKLMIQSNTVWGGMAYSIENFADSGASALANFFNGTKTGFREMVASLLLDIEKLILKEQLVMPFLKGMTGMNWGSLFGSSSGYSPSSLGNMGSFGTDLGTSWGGAFAGGGVTAPGKHYLVGENGPELFVPGQTGTVVPNGGGATTINSTVTVNVSSGGNVDAKASGNMGAQAASMLEGVVHQTIQKMMRPGGVLNQVGARS